MDFGNGKMKQDRISQNPIGSVHPEATKHDGLVSLEVASSG